MKLLNTIPDFLYDVSRKCIFKVGNVVLILLIFEQVVDSLFSMRRRRVGKR